MSNQTEISISQDLVKDLVNVLLKFDSVKSREIAAELNKKLGGWQPLAELRGKLLGDADEVFTGTIVELSAPERRTGVLAVSVRIPNTSPADMLVVIDQRELEYHLGY